MTSEFLKTALDAVKNAEKIILKHYVPGVRAEMKQDNSPVTLADREAEQVIIDTIKLRFPDHGFLGEEGGKQGDSEYVWVIDPIDGTLNYIRGIFLFSTELALVRDGVPVLGVSNIPMLKKLMYAEKGKGAFLNGEPIKVSDRSLSDAYVTFGNLTYFEKKGHIPGLLSLLKSSWKNRGHGDFIGYHFVAQGSVDAMLEAKVKIWDIAAQKVIVEEAGGKMTDFQGNPFGEDVSTIIASNGKFHDRIVEFLGNKVPQNSA